MRFAITAFDLYSEVFESFLRAGWEPVKLFTFPVPETPCSGNRLVVARAQMLKIPIQLSRMTDNDMQDLQRRGCDILIGAGYGWRIGDWRPYLPYAINFHPSLLPEGRGAYPAVRAILENRPHWGVTCHKFDKEFDTGDILAQETFPLTSRDCHDSLTMRAQMTLARLAGRVANDFPALWNNAVPQVPGEYWKRFTDQDRTLDFSKPVDTILRTVAAFGVLETLAQLKDSPGVLYVRRAVGWSERHDHAPGTLVHRNGRSIVVAAADGYIALIEWSFMDPVAFAEVGR